MFLKTDSNAMVIRWWMAIQELDFKIKFIVKLIKNKSTTNSIADALSRFCINRMTSINPLNEILTHGSADAKITGLIWPFSAFEKSWKRSDQTHYFKYWKIMTWLSLSSSSFNVFDLFLLHSRALILVSFDLLLNPNFTLSSAIFCFVLNQYGSDPKRGFDFEKPRRWWHRLTYKN